MLVSFPNGYCFIYAIAYRLGLLSIEEIMYHRFPTLFCMHRILLRYMAEHSDDASICKYIQTALDSYASSFIVEDDTVLKLSVVNRHLIDVGHITSLDLPLLSDLVVIDDDNMGHVYFNPHGSVPVTPPQTFDCLLGARRRNKLTTNRSGNVKLLKPVVRPVIVRAAPQPQPQQPKKKVTKVGQFLRAAGGVAGAYFGAPVTGQAIGAGISRIFGQGDYRVQKNSVMSGPPSFSPLNNGIRITHREYIQDIFSSTDYSVSTFRIQPNAQKTFPWLSQLASSFEQYKVNGCVVYLNTTSGNAVSSTNNALGVWGVTTVYDPSKPPLATKIQAEEYNGCTSSVPSSSVLHAVECKARSDVLDRYYVDYTSDVTGEDLKFYDHGLINVFTQGQQQSLVNLGELWISYDITFYNPRIQPVAETSVADHFSLSGTGITLSNPVGASTTIKPTSGSGINSTMIGGAGDNTAVINIPSNTAPGKYLFVYAYSSANAATAPLIAFSSVSTNMSSANILSNSTGSVLTANTGSTGQMITMKAFTKSDTAGCTVKITATVLPAASATCTVDIFIVPLGSLISKTKLDTKIEDFFNLHLEQYLLSKGYRPRSPLHIQDREEAKEISYDRFD